MGGYRKSSEPITFAPPNTPPPPAPELESACWTNPPIVELILQCHWDSDCDITVKPPLEVWSIFKDGNPVVPTDSGWVNPRQFNIEFPNETEPTTLTLELLTEHPNLRGVNLQLVQPFGPVDVPQCPAEE